LAAWPRPPPARSQISQAATAILGTGFKALVSGHAHMH
jgi:hypothetical protein